MKIIALVMFLTFSHLIIAQDLVVVVHPSHEAEEVTMRELKNIFLGKKTQWSDGEQIKPVLLREKSVYESFLKKYMRFSVFQFDRYWKRMIFTGQGTPPPALKTPEAIIEFVSSTPGAVSFIKVENIPDEVKTLKVK